MKTSSRQEGQRNRSYHPSSLSREGNCQSGSPGAAANLFDHLPATSTPTYPPQPNHQATDHRGNKPSYLLKRYIGF